MTPGEPRTVTMSPSEALVHLTRFEDREGIDFWRVATYATHLRLRLPLPDGDPIEFDRRGCVKNGRHRILACVMAWIPMRVEVVDGAN